ncbi:RS10 protein, partial [Polyodon spathula]|nr:RS10 protein [Polyodon spathula]
MLMPKKNCIANYELLFKEGIMMAKKDVHLAKHPELADKNMPNLHVMKTIQSLKSTSYVKEHENLSCKSPSRPKRALSRGTCMPVQRWAGLERGAE